MGLLDNILGGDTRRGGGPSKMTLALLALLAYRTYQGKGRLADMLDRGEPGAQPVPGGGANRSGSATGGLGGILGDLLGGRSGGTSGGGGLSDLLRGGLGGALAGGAGGGLLGTGLSELLRRMQQSGHEDAANSWVGTGQNRQIGSKEIEAAVGRDTVQSLADETGKPYDEVLADLSEGLPHTVDKLTPAGRLPTEDEQRTWL